MPCARTKPLPKMTLRRLQEMAGGTVFSCLFDLPEHMRKPKCVEGGRCVCTDIEVEYEGEGWICGESVRPCSACGFDGADFLCDFPVGEGKTCDAEICEECALPAGVALGELAPDELAQRRDPESRRIFDRRLAIQQDRHYCPTHYAIVSKWTDANRPGEGTNGRA